MSMRRIAVGIGTVALALSGLAALGEVATAGAGSGPLLTCGVVGPSSSGPGTAITFNNGTTGVYLAARAQASDVLIDPAYNGDTSITINAAVVRGQTLTVAGFTGTYTVTDVSYENAENPDPDVVTVTPALTGNLAKGGETKAKGIVAVNATDGSGTTEAYNPDITENVDLALSGCASSADAPGEFSPTQADITGTATVSNSAVALTATPAALNATVTFPNIGSGWTQPVATAVGWDSAKGNSFNHSDYDLVYADGAVTGDFATSKSAELNLSVLGGMTVCTQGELEAIAGTGPDTGTIHEGASELAVCDGGTDPAYTGLTGLQEIAEAESAPGGTQLDGNDGTPIVAVWGLEVISGGSQVV